MAESGANVKTFLAIEVPGGPCASFLVYCDMESDWSNGSGVVVKETVEVRPI